MTDQPRPPSNDEIGRYLRVKARQWVGDSTGWPALIFGVVIFGSIAIGLAVLAWSLLTWLVGRVF